MSQDAQMGGNAFAPIQEIIKQSVGRNQLAGTGTPRGKLPPQALDMEQAVLGALLLEKDALSKIIDVVNPSMFYKDSHRAIYESIYELFQDSQPVDILTVKNHLSLKGNLDMIGGVYYITELTSRVASAANIEYHARVIAQKFLLRELIKIGDGIVKDAYDETTDVFDLLDKSERDA